MKFFNVKTVAETLEVIARQFAPVRQPVTLPLGEALGLVLAEDVISAEQVPHFSRSTVDGYAVRAKDTYGASDSLPAFLDIQGKIEMGKIAGLLLREGQAQAIPTGGMIPDGADSVVMIEHVEEVGDLLNVFRQVSPGENMIRAGDDVQTGELVMAAGQRLRPQDLGVLAAIGKTSVSVYPRPIVAILSTGDEIVPSDKQELAPGEIRDINSMTIGAAARACGAEVIEGGIVQDDFDAFFSRAQELFQQADLLLLSGGSSVGTRDYTERVMQSLGDPGVLVHGVSIKPGKPTILAKAGEKPIMGLPGHPASALIIFHLFTAPLIAQLEGVLPSHLDKRIMARISRNIPSAVGRSDYVRVKLEKRGEEWWAQPVYGKSGLISTLVKSDGMVEIAANKEGIMEGEFVRVHLFH